MKNMLISSLCILGFASMSAQFEWNWQELPSMPEAISNNAVAEGEVDGVVHVFTFSGIDSTKTNDGISLHSMKYNMESGDWSYLPELPDTLGKIAAAASTVDNIIYIIGGYHVFDGPPYELSSDKVHRYDPELGEYLSDGVSIPVAIDDQVQSVWRDSLIYVVTGWSDNQNVPNVQIYNPYLDEWSQGTPVPNNSIYKAFGASGVILGDTIFYNGGAVGSSFSASGRLRKGVIDPEDPTQISWSQLGDNPGDKGYRMAAVTADDKVFWIGGSGVTYNYDGIAYNGSGGVDPLHRVLAFDPSLTAWSVMDWQPYGMMDLRGAAKVGEGQYVICGGMETDQAVTDKAFLLTYGGVSSLMESHQETFSISNSYLSLEALLPLTTLARIQLSVFDQKGSVVGEVELNSGEHQLSLAQLGIETIGTYLLIDLSSRSEAIRLIVIE